MTFGIWQDDREATLKKLWRDGYSASQCAAKMGTTRNAICGKVHRLGLPSRKKEVRKPTPAYLRPVVRTSRVIRVKPIGRQMRVEEEFNALPSEIRDLPPDTSPDACTIAELTDTSCRWPMGDPDEPTFRYCGSAKRAGSYCPRHARMAYRPVGERRYAWKDGAAA